MTTVDLIVDCERRRLVNSAGTYVSDMPVFIRGDILLLRIRFVKVNRLDSPYVVSPISFEEGAEFYFCGKSTLAGQALVLSGPDQWNRAGDWEEADPLEGTCSCRVNFNGVSLKEEIGSKPNLPMYFDVSMRTEAGNEATLLLLRLELLNDVHQGDETVPDPADEYPTMDDLNDRIGQGIHLVEEDGGMAVYVNGTKRGVI